MSDNSQWSEAEAIAMDAMVRQLIYKVTGGLNVNVVFPGPTSLHIDDVLDLTYEFLAVDRPDVFNIVTAFVTKHFEAEKAGEPLPLQSAGEAIARDMFFDDGPMEFGTLLAQLDVTEDEDDEDTIKKKVKEMIRPRLDGGPQCRRRAYLNHTRCCLR